MPLNKLHVCNKMGCNELTRNRFCSKHAYIEAEERKRINRNYNQKRTDDKEQAFYKTTIWKQIRKMVLIRDEYLCKDCMRIHKITPAQTVHHIIPLKIMWNQRTNKINLISLCESCHQERHKKMNEKEMSERIIQIIKQHQLREAIRIINELTAPTKNL